MSRLIDNVKEFIERESLLPQGSRVIIGLSGGADSVCLLSIMTRLGYDCIAVHCHFGLRGDEADRDAKFSEEIAAKLGAKFILKYCDTKDFARKYGISIEMAAREQRYSEFEIQYYDNDAEAIAVGHHREDNVETMLLNLLRGCGIHGAKGMLPRHNNVIRPLLDTPRAEILQYLEEENLPFIVDSSNLENDFKRNKLRNIVIPTIIEQFPDAMKTLSDSVWNLRENCRLYDELIPERSDSLDGLNPVLLFEWLWSYGFNFDQCKQMLTANPGAQFDSHSHKVTICSGKRYELTELDKEEAMPMLGWNQFRNDRLFFMRDDCLYMDTDSIPRDAKYDIRLWREGDRMRPFGMKGTRMVSDVMKDCGISASQRRKTWLMTINDEVVWIIGHRTSALYPVTEKTEYITEISICHDDI